MSMEKVINDFKNLETGVDETFYELPEAIRSVVEGIADQISKDAANPTRVFVRLLDRSEEYRTLIGVKDPMEHPKKTDCCVRWFEWSRGIHANGI